MKFAKCLEMRVNSHVLSNVFIKTRISFLETLLLVACVTGIYAMIGLTIHRKTFINFIAHYDDTICQFCL